MRIGPFHRRAGFGACLAFVINSSVCFSGVSAAIFSGTVREEGSAVPLAGALVSIQATGIRTITDASGAYSLEVSSPTASVVVAALKGFYNEAAPLPEKGEPIEFYLEPVPQHHDPNYNLMTPNQCGVCHPDQLADWLDSPMANAGVNTWVHDLYDGSGTPWGTLGFVYLRDSVLAPSNPNSECASCHQPEAWIYAPFSRMETPLDEGYPSAASMHGVSCDICHKIADVDVTKIDYPGLYPGAVTFTLPQGPAFPQVQYGLLGDTSFQISNVMRPSYQPQLVAEVCGACHQDKNDPHETGEFDGVISEPTYTEWRESPYGDVNSASYTTCVDCHMPSSGRVTACNVPFSAPVRESGSIRSHRILGTTPLYLENAAELDLRANVVGDELRVRVDVSNTQTGHHLPTGVTVRNMILLVDARREGDSAPLESIGDQVVHELGGTGDTTQGYYAGLPGKLYAKVIYDAQGVEPTFFTDAAGIRFDNRIPALATDRTDYTFIVPEGGGSLQVSARLIYRRAFRALVDTKGWTEDGHGRPLEDLLPPYYGHLMEEEEIALGVCPTNFDGDGRVNQGELFIVAEKWGETGPAGWIRQDVVWDGVVNQTDLLAILDSWGRLCP